MNMWLKNPIVVETLRLPHWSSAVPCLPKKVGEENAAVPVPVTESTSTVCDCYEIVGGLASLLASSAALQIGATKVW